jgi:hypothetical protein
VVVLANDHHALHDAELLQGCAPGALVFDLSGVLAPTGRTDLRVHRFGRGGAT